MDNNNIKSIGNNGGHYSGQVITNAIDGKLDTYWETNKANKGDLGIIKTNRIIFLNLNELNLNLKIQIKTGLHYQK